MSTCAFAYSRKPLWLKVFLTERCMKTTFYHIVSSPRYRNASGSVFMAHWHRRELKCISCFGLFAFLSVVWCWLGLSPDWMDCDRSAWRLFSFLLIHDVCHVLSPSHSDACTGAAWGAGTPWFQRQMMAVRVAFFGLTVVFTRRVSGFPGCSDMLQLLDEVQRSGSCFH